MLSELLREYNVFPSKEDDKENDTTVIPQDQEVEWDIATNVEDPEQQDNIQIIEPEHQGDMNDRDPDADGFIQFDYDSVPFELDDFSDEDEPDEDQESAKIYVDTLNDPDQAGAPFQDYKPF